MSRLGRLLVVVMLVSFATFSMVAMLPADVAYQVAGEDATVEEVAAVRAELGLDDGIAVRYLRWIADIVTGDWGRSYASGEPVLETILQRLPVTLQLMLIAQVMALALAVPAALLAAWRAGTWIDYALNAAAFASASVPIFVQAIVLTFLFALVLQWLPVTGYQPFTEDPVANLTAFVLPGLSIALVEWMPLMRLLRTDLVATLKQDFILMARAKGLTTRQVLIGHALRPSLFSLVTLVGLQMGHLIGGAFVVEMIFALPGLGRLLLMSIFDREVAMVQGCILVTAIGYVTIHAGIDALYRVLDPRVADGQGGHG